METLDFRTLKIELKALALNIRDTKVVTKKTQKEGSPAGCLQYLLWKNKKVYRHKHIAYCLIRGRTYEQVEPKCREDNKPDQKLIQEIIDAYTPKDVCAGA